MSPAPSAGAGDAGATAYHAVGPTKGGLVGILIVKNGKLRDEIYKIHDGENVLGRAVGAEICIDSREDSISREHCAIIHEGGHFGVKPLKDTNPTFLNDEPVTGGAALTDGDEIRTGDTTFKFRVV